MKQLTLPKLYPVTCHTDNVGPCSTFVVIQGYQHDGAKYIEQAIKKGALKIVLDVKQQKTLIKQDGIEYIFVENTRKVLADLSGKSLNYPSTKLKIIGITGTKGKTTTTYLIEHILKQSGFKTALLGTIKNKILDFEIQSERTTPQSDFLHIFFDQCVKNNVDFVVMEVSSHALSLDRIHGIEFDTIGFTNLAPEHLDFYKNMNEYFQAKFKIFDHIKLNSPIVINSDDKWGQKAIKKLSVKNLNLIQFSKNDVKINSKNMPGEFNEYNITMSFLICKQLKISEEKIIGAIKNFDGIPGRMQKHILKNNAHAFIDYAHNPSSFEASLKALKKLNSNLIVVFGCGGDRDKTKRPIMGNIAAKYAKKIILTDDNPRFEDREQIIKEIYAGICQSKQKNVLCIPDRKIAIKKAVELSNEDSLIAILGKGHENYYSIKGKSFYFDDFEEISKY
ncbi:MAG: UDP-N-acetylmuramoyl-L-alanyl-D-glutamate--2,6-diaminopimelate ligase [bacterium]